MAFFYGHNFGDLVDFSERGFCAGHINVCGKIFLWVVKLLWSLRSTCSTARAAAPPSPPPSPLIWLFVRLRKGERRTGVANIGNLIRSPRLRRFIYFYLFQNTISPSWDYGKRGHIRFLGIYKKQKQRTLDREKPDKILTFFSYELTKLLKKNDIKKS